MNTNGNVDMVNSSGASSRKLSHIDNNSASHSTPGLNNYKPTYRREGLNDYLNQSFGSHSVPQLIIPEGIEQPSWKQLYNETAVDNSSTIAVWPIDYHQKLQSIHQQNGETTPVEVSKVVDVPKAQFLEEELKFTSPLGRVTFKHEIESLTEQLLNEDDNAYQRKYISINFQKEIVDNNTQDDSVYNLLTVGNPSLETLLESAKDVAEMGKIAMKALKKELPYRWPGIKDAVWDMPTIKAVLELHDNYELDAITNETVTQQQKDEEDKFIDVIIATNVMKKAMNFLIAKGYISDDIYKFKTALKDMWFTRFQRVKNIFGSSAFEYVFLAEKIDNNIIGLHNWIYYTKKESDKQLNYLGYFRSISLNDKGVFVEVKSRLNGTINNATTLFVGLSPELEISLYTLCFYISPWYPCPIKLANSKFTIYIMRYYYFGKDILISADTKFCISSKASSSTTTTTTTQSSNINNNEESKNRSKPLDLRSILLISNYFFILIVCLIMILRMLLKHSKSMDIDMCGVDCAIHVVESE